jgi:hypothetical protein
MSDSEQSDKKGGGLDDLFDESNSKKSSDKDDGEFFEGDFEFDPTVFNNLQRFNETSTTMMEIAGSKEELYNEETQNPGHSEFFGEKLGEFKQRDKKKQEREDKAIEKKKETLKAFVLFSSIIMRNPYHYQNFIKLYSLCLLARCYYMSKMAHSKLLLAMVLSKLSWNYNNELDRIREKYSESPKENLRHCLYRLADMIAINFKFESDNDRYILVNIACDDTFSYEHILQIFVCLCEYVGIHARLTNILDLRNLNVK